MIKKLLIKADSIYRRSPIFPVTNPLRTQLYCVGTAKSGTHSVEAIFRENLRSADEVDSEHVIDVVLDYANGRMSREELRAYLLKRDRVLQLELDSSQLNYFFLHELVELFPKAKFILTIRNPYAWLDSFINHQLSWKPLPN